MIKWGGKWGKRVKGFYCCLGKNGCMKGGVVKEILGDIVWEKEVGEFMWKREDGGIIEKKGEW